MLLFLEGLGVLALLFVLWKRGMFKGKAKVDEQVAAVGRTNVWYVRNATKQKGTTVLLLHDFAADKSQWSALLPLLEKEGYNVVAPDLPGFGSNVRDPEAKYDATSMAKVLRGFARTTDLGLFHLVGAGTGAVIAASYAYGMPAELASVTLVEPFKQTAPTESDFDKVMLKGRNPLL